MFKFNDIKLKYKILSILMLSGITPILILGISSTLKSKEMLQQKAIEKLVAVRDLKKSETEFYFQSKKNEISTLNKTLQSYYIAAEHMLYAAQKNKKAAVEQMFQKYWQDIKAQQIRSICTKGIPHYRKALTGQKTPTYTRFTKIIRQFIKDTGYYDYFIIDINGDIVYTDMKEPDFKTNLINGPYKTSGLAEVFRNALKTKKPAISDFSPYAPSNGQQAAFIGAPILSGGRTLGVVALQMNITPIHKVVGDRAGLGKTGESYLAGLNHGEIAFRSDLKTMGKGKFVTGYKVKTKYLTEALIQGKNGKGLYKDSSGNLVMVIYDNLEIHGIKWALVTKMDMEEALNPKEGNSEDFFTAYIKKHHYYDFFLISTDGFIFYTVAKESDYHTNIISGEFSSSNFGTLIKEAKASDSFKIIDFQPYAPSNGDAAAFMGTPVKIANETRFFIALQIDLTEINQIMTQKTGMGQTGESYLVGPDFKMRSVAPNDPQNRNVIKSFHGNIKDNGVKSEFIERALRDETGCGQIKNYAGKSVLSAYTPIKIEDMKWVLITEQETAESFSAVREVIISSLIIIVIGLISIFFISIWFAGLLTRPIIQGVKFAERIADGDLTERIDIKQKDEIGDLSRALNRMSESLSSIIRKLVEDVLKIGDASGVLNTISLEMSEKTETSNSKAGEINKEAEAISSMMDNVAASMEQASSNLNTIASSVEEMNVTVKEISENTSKTTRMSGEAAEKAVSVTDIVKNLGEAAQEIGNVTSTISDISNQTNLLALNATIEAARAGESGKGFAVVANEIKDLADQTAKATSEISSKIEGIQSSTQASVTEVIDIANLIQEINDFVSGIAVAIEEQTATTNEIATNVGQASAGIDEINTSVSGAAESTSNVSSEMEFISRSSQELTTTSGDIQSNSEKLSSLSQELEEMIKGFKVSK